MSPSQPWSRKQLIQIRSVLVHLYPTEKDQRRVVRDAGLRPELMGFETKAINSWFAILDHAKHQQNGVQNLLRVAREENPGEETLALLEQGAPITVDPQPKREPWPGPTGRQQLEQIIGEQSTLVDISFLEIGLEKAKSVARIRTPAKLGTGFLIEDNILVTNNHILPDIPTARASKAQFNYQKGRDGSVAEAEKIGLLPDEFFKTSEEDDWTAVRVEGEPNAAWGRLALGPAMIGVGDRVNIIQHPGGLPKQLSYLANTVVHEGDGRLFYLTDTEPGSSGSPVFDMHWNVVAVHRAGWDPDETFDYARNEGVIIDKVIEGLADKGLI